MDREGEIELLSQDKTKVAPEPKAEPVYDVNKGVIYMLLAALTASLFGIISKYLFIGTAASVLQVTLIRGFFFILCAYTDATYQGIDLALVP